MQQTLTYKQHLEDRDQTLASHLNYKQLGNYMKSYICKGRVLKHAAHRIDRQLYLESSEYT